MTTETKILLTILFFSWCFIEFLLKRNNILKTKNEILEDKKELLEAELEILKNQ